MNPEKYKMNMSDKYDYSSAEQAHWRIDEVIKTMGGLTDVVEEHDRELAEQRAFYKGLKIAVYTAAGVIVSSEVGVFTIIKSYLGL